MSDQSQELDEAKQSQLDILLRLGLAKHPDKINYYRKVLNNPMKVVSDPLSRPFGAEVLETLMHILLTDSVIFNRTKTILSRSKIKITEDEKRSAFAVALRVIKEGRTT
jgi:hypothetical protein